MYVFRQLYMSNLILSQAYEAVLSETVPGYNDGGDKSDNGSDDDTPPICRDKESDEESSESGEDNNNMGPTDINLGGYKPSRKRTKNYNFPKLHNQSHAFDDIEARGILDGYTTRFFEGLHWFLKKWYRSQTNFRNVEPQVCMSLAAIRSNLILGMPGTGS